MTVSLMDSNTTEYEEFLRDPEKLLEYLRTRIEDIDRILDDDKDFCNKEIDTTIQYVEKMEKKFNEKIQEFKDKLEQIRIENEKTSEKNKEEFDVGMQEINTLFFDRKHSEAWQKFQDYQKRFQQRPILIKRIPKLHMTELDIEQFFSPDSKPNKPLPIQSTIVVPPTRSTDDDKQDSIDDRQMTNKERLRQQKIIETDTINKDDEEVNDEKPEIDNSLFGSRSKRVENQQSTINGAIKNDTKPPLTTDFPRPSFRFSTRLGASSNPTNLSSSRHNVPTQNPNINIRNSPEQRQPTTNPLKQRQMTSANNRKLNSLTLNPVSHYKYEPNKFLLMTCNYQYIVLFKSQINRLDKWELGVIERRFQNQNILDWHDGLIISMGYIENDQIYMFTEREFIIYSLNQRRKLNSRILPRGNDDGFEISSDSQRGIGTVYNKYMYHIYLNRNSRWTLSKTSLDKLAHIHDYDLTRLFPDVMRFIHLCVNEKTIHFLVQMNDYSYAVVYCSTNDCTINQSISPITLSSAKQPLTIYSAFIRPINREVVFINDPSTDILHILTNEEYLTPYPITAHAICYVADKHELMIVTNNAISSINLNEENLFFSKFSVNY